MKTIVWYIENILIQGVQMFPAMAVALLLWIALRPIRLRELEKRGMISLKRREAGLLLFVLFCAGLIALTVFPYGFWKEIIQIIQKPGYSPDIRIPDLEESVRLLKQLPYSLTPFQEIRRVSWGGPWLWFVLWGNIGMFMPVGFSIPLFWRDRKWYHVLGYGGGFSLCIELIQVFAGRVSDIDDLLLNTSGCLIGFWLYCICCKVIPLNWNNFRCREKEAA